MTDIAVPQRPMSSEKTNNILFIIILNARLAAKSVQFAASQFISIIYILSCNNKLPLKWLSVKPLNIGILLLPQVSIEVRTSTT